MYAAELAEIQRRGYVVVAVKDNVRPMGFVDGEGNLQGLEIDLAHRLAEELLGDPQAVVLQPVSNQDRLTAVLEGEVDLAIARVTATASRSRIVNLSEPYYSDGTALITRNASIRRLSDLSRQFIAVLEGSSSIATVQSLLPSALLVGVSSYEEARQWLETGQADAFAADASVLAGWVQDEPAYFLLPTLLSAEPLAVVMPRGVQYDDLRRRVNGAIARWRDEGWLQERIQYWGLPQ